VPTVTVVAPAGYGKTTLLALWAAADDRPFAWLSLDAYDNDPIILLTHLAVALDRISPLPAGVFDALRSVGVSVPGTVVPRLGSALAGLPREVVLVLDDVHHLQDGPSLCRAGGDAEVSRRLRNRAAAHRHHPSSDPAAGGHRAGRPVHHHR
jgi:LuxR family transcriptional regulator, maltose regulon positive regulatory protein